jgi:Domain of unknown function (DUF5916)/Carbohydrate family 9 binding domain-like
LNRYFFIGIFLPLAITGTLHAAEESFPKPRPETLPHTSGEIKLDGDLNDAGWKNALIVDHFYETSPANNIPAKVKTTAFLTYDDSYFYIGVKADDPDVSKIRAPYVERDQVIGTDDNLAIFLDTRNDKRSALELRVNPRGIQADGIFDDINGIEDFSPDFFYDTAAKITPQGWQAEFRIPLTTLRYPKTDPQTWGILIWRNYPRDFRYAFHSAPIERGSNCFICHTHELTGISQLPTSRHLIVAPYATGSHLSHRDGEGDTFHDESDGDVGVDVKWNPTANSAIDATIQPDFSQVESDVPQIATNQRFALFFPEKRPFFLEGSDLFNSPIQLVYTRTITDPQWGLRGTGKIGDATSYTVLGGKDQGGGLVVIPGPFFSDFAPQDFDSTVTLGRLRHDFGLSFASFMFTDREISGGGHNRVLGPDAQWRPNQSDLVTGQFLFSSTEDPIEPPFFSGASADSYAATVQWSHQVYSYDWFARYRDFGDDFRADVGFVPQSGYREILGGGGLRFYPTGKFLNFIRTYAFADKFYFTDGDDLGHDYYPGIFMQGSRNLAAQFEYHDNKVAVSNDDLLTQRYLTYFIQLDPSRRLPRITFQGRVGDLIDFENARVGTGTNITLTATIRPTVHLTLTADAAREWLNLDEPLATGRLYTADIARLKAVYTFNARSFVRAIGQYVNTKRDPLLYTFDVPVRDGNFLGSILYGYRLNWQTVLFVGYGDNGIINDSDYFFHTDRSFFIKVSYAWQR